MRRLWLYLLCFVPLPLGVVLVSLSVDPVRLASGDAYERGIAAMLLAGQGVTNIANPKDAAVVRYVIDGLPASPEVIVLGSSRSKLIRARFFGTRSFFNNSVSGGGMTDYLAIYDLYRQRHFAPKRVLIEVSPWVLANGYVSIWEDRYPPRRELEREVLENQPPAAAWRAGVGRSLTRLLEIISPGYFQTSLMTWIHQTRGGAAAQQSYVKFESGDVPLQETQLPDGSVIYAERTLKDMDRAQLRVQAIAYAGGLTWVPSPIDSARMAVFEALIRRLHADGAEVILYVPPYHPMTYDRMIASRESANLPGVERAIRDLAKRTNSTVIGSFDPRAVGFSEDDFFDPSHPNADAIARLFAGRWSHEAADASDIRITSISNANGLEARDGRPFFWIGQGPACISLKTSVAGWARITFAAEAGPSLPETAKRRLLVTSTAGGAAQVMAFEAQRQLSVVVPVASGLTDACFTALDRPTVSRLGNGDGRPLLVAAIAPRVEATTAPPPTPAAAPVAAAAACRVTFAGQGWYPAEVDGTNWRRWMSGPAELIVSADGPGQIVLTGEAVGMTRPDHVEVRVGEMLAGGFDIPGGDWAFRPFLPVTISVDRGETRLTLRPTNPAVTQPTDPRHLAVAIQNLTATMDGATAPCALQR